MLRSVLMSLAAVLVIAGGGHLEAQNRAAYFTGEVQIETTNEGEVLVALDEAESWTDADGVADHLFILQQDEPYKFVSQWLREATLLFTENRLAIISRSERFALILAVEGAPVTELADSVVAFRPDVVRGFGLSHTYDGLDVPINVAASQEFVTPPGDTLKVPELPGEKGGICDSGGPGSTSCSVQGCGGQPSSCSVSCSSRYYACCFCESFGNGRARCQCWQ